MRLVSGLVLPLLGWRTLFVIGGVVPLFLLVLLVRYLPESPSFLSGRPGGIARVHATLRAWIPTFPPVPALSPVTTSV